MIATCLLMAGLLSARPHVCLAYAASPFALPRVSPHRIILDCIHRKELLWHRTKGKVPQFRPRPQQIAQQPLKEVTMDPDRRHALTSTALLGVAAFAGGMAPAISQAQPKVNAPSTDS